LEINMERDLLPCLFTNEKIKFGSAVTAIFEKTPEVLRRLVVYAKETGTPLPLFPVSTTAVAIYQQSAWPFTTWNSFKGSFSFPKGHRLGPFVAGMTLPLGDRAWPPFPHMKDKWFEEMLLLHEDGSLVRNFCAVCPARVKCSATGGPDGMPEASMRRSSERVGERIESRCPLFMGAVASLDPEQAEKFHVDFDDEPYLPMVSWAPLLKNKILTNAKLIDLGFCPYDRWSLFDKNLGLREGRWENRSKVDEISMAFAILLSRGMLHENWRIVRDNIYELGVGKTISGLSWRTPARTMEDYSFTNEQIQLSKMATKAASALRAGPAADLRQFRKDNCSRCVYNCARPPWSLSSCVLSKEMVTQSFDGVSPETLSDWIASFAISNAKTTWKKRSLVIGWGPDAPPADKKPITMALRSLSVPFIIRDRIPLTQYMSLWPGLEDLYVTARHTALNMTKEERANVGFALLKLAEYSHWRNDKARFYARNLTTRKGNNRPFFARNDVLSIWIAHDLKDIVVYSDTRAGTDGMGWGTRGDPIPRGDRPRFSTNYKFPFFSDILQITRSALGSSRETQSLGYGRF
jgi:hypothetical protein